MFEFSLDAEYVLLSVLVLFIMTLFSYLTYSGLLTRVEVETSETAYGPMVVAYKARTGPYRAAGDLYTESYCLLPNRQQIGIYYDDPQVRFSFRISWWCRGAGRGLGNFGRSRFEGLAAGSGADEKSKKINAILFVRSNFDLGANKKKLQQNSCKKSTGLKV